MIAILYPLKMDKNLSEAYSSIYESSASAGSSGGHYSDGGDGVFRSKEQVGSHFNKNFPPKKNGKVDKRMRSAINTSARDFGIQGPTTTKDSYEPEGEVIEGKKYGLTKGSGKPGGAMKAYLDKKAEKLQKEKDNQKPEYKNNPAFGDPSHHSNKKMQYNSRYRREWEEIKLMEMNEYRDSFEKWLTGLVEEGYDIDRWDDADLIETFINERDLWDSIDTVLNALTEAKDKKGKGSGKKDACYHKVKANSDVWPSAYASGRLVQCRKKGAKNWGKSKKEEVEYGEVEVVSEVAGTIGKEVGKQLVKKAVRTGIRLGGKTGGKVVKTAIKQGGQELKRQAVQTAGEVATAGAKKVGEKVREKAGAGTNESVLHEFVESKPKKKPGMGEKIGGVVGSIGGGAAGGAAGGGVASLATGVAGSLAGEAAGKKIGRAIDKKFKPKTKVNSSFSNWRGELSLDENRATAYTAGMSDGQKAAEMNKISPKVADSAGRSHDKFMFGSRKKGGSENRKYEKEIRKSIPSDKPNRNKTGRGTPVSYRKGYEDTSLGRYQSKIRQGKGSIKDLGKKK